MNRWVIFALVAVLSIPVGAGVLNVVDWMLSSKSIVSAEFAGWSHKTRQSPNGIIHNYYIYFKIDGMKYRIETGPNYDGMSSKAFIGKEYDVIVRRTPILNRVWVKTF